MHRLVYALSALAIAVYLALPGFGIPNQCKRTNLTPVAGIQWFLSEHAEWLRTRDNAQPLGRRADLRDRKSVV